jgi:hypothetical protein
MDGLLVLSAERKEKMIAVFRRFDIDGDGYLSLKEMRVLGWAISGCRHVPTDAEAAVQMARVAPPGSSFVSLPAFLAFSVRLARLSDESFAALMVLLEDGCERASARSFELPAGESPSGAAVAGGSSVGGP